MLPLPDLPDPPLPLPLPFPDLPDPEGSGSGSGSGSGAGHSGSGAGHSGSGSGSGASALPLPLPDPLLPLPDLPDPPLPLPFPDLPDPEGSGAAGSGSDSGSHHPSCLSRAYDIGFFGVFCFCFLGHDVCERGRARTNGCEVSISIIIGQTYITWNASEGVVSPLRTPASDGTTTPDFGPIAAAAPMMDDAEGKGRGLTLMLLASTDAARAATMAIVFAIFIVFFLSAA